MRFVNEKSLWQDSEVRLNLQDPEIANAEKEISVFQVETSETREAVVLTATNLRLFAVSRGKRGVNSAPWPAVRNLSLVASGLLTVEIAGSADWHFQTTSTFKVDQLREIKNMHAATMLYRQVVFRSPIVKSKQLDLLPKEKIFSEVAGVWNVSGDAGNLGKLVITNFRLVWFGVLQENSNVSIPHVTLKLAETRNSKFGKILVIETCRSAEGAMLGFRIDPETALERVALEIARVAEAAISKHGFLGFDALETPAQPIEKKEEKLEKAVTLVSRVTAGSGDSEEFCPELGLMIKRLPKGVTYASLWQIV